MACKIRVLFKKAKLSLKCFLIITNWWDYFLDYFGIKKGYLIYKIGNKKIKTRAGSIDKSIITEVVLKEKYFPKELNIKEGSIVIDLGAHIGIFSILIGSKFKNVKVYSVEPDKYNFKLLLEQIKINKCNIKPFKLAISNKNGRAKLYLGKHSARPSIIKWIMKDYYFVKTTTLKDFFDKEKIEKCSLLKIDIEGAEYNVLYSTPQRIFNIIENILFELHEVDGENKIKLINFLKKRGFIVKINKDKNFVYAINQGKK